MASNIMPSSLLQLTLPPAALKQSSAKQNNNKLMRQTTSCVVQAVSHLLDAAHSLKRAASVAMTARVPSLLATDRQGRILESTAGMWASNLEPHKAAQEAAASRRGGAGRAASGTRERMQATAWSLLTEPDRAKASTRRGCASWGGSLRRRVANKLAASRMVAWVGLLR
jgi:hypothetical protein